MKLFAIIAVISLLGGGGIAAATYVGMVDWDEYFSDENHHIDYNRNYADERYSVIHTDPAVASDHLYYAVTKCEIYDSIGYLVLKESDNLRVDWMGTGYMFTCEGEAGLGSVYIPNAYPRNLILTVLDSSGNESSPFTARYYVISDTSKIEVQHVDTTWLGCDNDVYSTERFFNNVNKNGLMMLVRPSDKNGVDGYVPASTRGIGPYDDSDGNWDKYFMGTNNENYNHNYAGMPFNIVHVPSDNTIYDGKFHSVVRCTFKDAEGYLILKETESVVMERTDAGYRFTYGTEDNELCHILLPEIEARELILVDSEETNVDLDSCRTSCYILSNTNWFLIENEFDDKDSCDEYIEGAERFFNRVNEKGAMMLVQATNVAGADGYVAPKINEVEDVDKGDEIKGPLIAGQVNWKEYFKPYDHMKEYHYNFACQRYGTLSTPVAEASDAFYAVTLYSMPDFNGRIVLKVSDMISVTASDSGGYVFTFTGEHGEGSVYVPGARMIRGPIKWYEDVNSEELHKKYELYGGFFQLKNEDGHINLYYRDGDKVLLLERDYVYTPDFVGGNYYVISDTNSVEIQHKAGTEQDCLLSIHEAHMLFSSLNNNNLIQLVSSE